MAERVPLLIISGPVGVGKTTTGEEVSAQLVDRAVHTFIDFDALAGTFPRQPGDRFGLSLAMKNLRDVWRNCSEAGSRNLILPYVIESEADRDAIAGCIPGADVFLVQLTASIETLEARLRKREIGTSFEKGLARATELVEILDTAPADLRVTTDDRTVPELASELTGRVDWA